MPCAAPRRSIEPSCSAGKCPAMPAIPAHRERIAHSDAASCPDLIRRRFDLLEAPNAFPVDAKRRPARSRTLVVVYGSDVGPPNPPLSNRLVAKECCRMLKWSALTQSFDRKPFAAAVAVLVVGGLTLGCSSSDEPVSAKKPEEPEISPGT